MKPCVILSTGTAHLYSILVINTRINTLSLHLLR